MTTSQSWWILETLRSSTYRLRMPHRCSIGFRSGDMPGQSITFTLSFFSKAVVILEVCVRSLSCWNTVLWPSLRKEGYIMICFTMNHGNHECWHSWFPQWTVAPQCRQHSCSPRPWHSQHYLLTPHLVAATYAWQYLNQISLSWSHLGNILIAYAIFM